MNRYSYQTFPGQTIVAIRDTGFTAEELRDELDQNADGQIVFEDENIPAEIADLFPSVV